MPSWSPIPPGTVLRDRYEVEALSGRGGFGATYRVRDRERFGQLCALKELLPSQAENPKVRELFEREARTLLSLRHVGIPSFHAFFFYEGRFYLVEDYIAGKTLAQELEEEGRFSEGKVSAIVDEVMAILEYLHGRSPAVVHRDIKPANIIRATSGALYLVDFGAVKEAMVVAALSAESTIIGTSGYTPPEQLRGVVVPASDLYAVGATALQLLTGRSPAELYNVIEGAWRFAGKLGVSPRLEAILGRLVEEQLSRRFQSATAVREALRGEPVETMATRAMSYGAVADRPVVADSRPATATAAPTSTRFGAPTGSRQWLFIGAAAVVLFVAGGALALKTLAPSSTDRPVARETAAAPAAPSAPAPSAPAPPAAAPAPSAPAAVAPAVPATPRPARSSDTGSGVRARDRDSALTTRSTPAPAAPTASSAAPASTGAAPPTVSTPPAPPAVASIPAPRRAERSASGLPQQTYPVSVDQVWLTAERVLKSLGWDIDKRDRAAGILSTESRHLDGDNFVVYANEIRHLLRLRLTRVDEGRTLVTVERVMFRRERFIGVPRDQPMAVPEPMRNGQTEQDVLAAIGRAL